MINRWDRGRAEIDQLIHQGRLTHVAANRDLAASHLTQASTHLAAAATLRDLDPAGAFTLAYDAARLALAAVLVNQGLSHAVRARTLFCSRQQLLNLSHLASGKSASSTGCADSATIPSTRTSTARRPAPTMSIRPFPPRERLWIEQRDLLK